MHSYALLNTARSRPWAPLGVPNPTPKQNKVKQNSWYKALACHWLWGISVPFLTFSLQPVFLFQFCNPLCLSFSASEGTGCVSFHLGVIQVKSTVFTVWVNRANRRKMSDLPSSQLAWILQIRTGQAATLKCRNSFECDLEVEFFPSSVWVFFQTKLWKPQFLCL